MKNLYKLSGIIALAAIIGFTFAALSLTGCDNGNGKPHIHSYSTTWSKNATQHWHECSCGEKTNVANHTGDPCTVCGYTSSSSPTDPNSSTYTGYDGSGAEYKLVITKAVNNPGNGGGNSGLNGTWVNQAGEVWVFNNGNLTVSDDGVEFARGTYTTSGNTISLTFTQIIGAAAGSDGAAMGLSPNQWYTKSQFRTAIINYAVSQGLSQSQAAAIADEAVDEIFGTMTGPYTLSGNTLTIDGAILTSQGGRSAAPVSFSRVVGSSPAGRAAYAPQSGDTYRLTFSTKYSTGTIEVISTGSTITLKLTSTKGSGTITVTVSGDGIVSITTTGIFNWDDGTTFTAPGTLTPTKPTNPGHTHTYSSTWSYNATQHWHECTANDGAKTAVANHTGSPCTVCGYSSGGGTGNLQNWTAVTNSPFGTTSRIDIVVYGNNRFIAVYNNRAMAYSTDGANWTAVTNPFGTDLILCLDFGAGKFVAGSFRDIAYSTDAVNWTLVTDCPFDTNIQCMIYGNNKFIAMSSSMAAHSPDGASWTLVSDTGAGDYPTSDGIAFGGGRFVAGHANEIEYSTDDCVTWTKASNTIYRETGGPYDVAYGNGRFMVTGTSGIMGYSTDGTTWTVVADTTFGGTGIGAITYGNGIWVAGGGSGKAAFSADGINWTAVANSTFTSSSIFAIAYGNGRFVAGGFSGKMAYCDW